MRALALSGTLAVGLATSAAAEPGFVAIDVSADPIRSFTIDEPISLHGEIAFRGGLVLRSSHEHFGGFSGLDVTANGAMVAVTDTGFWLVADLLETEGLLMGIGNAMMAPILDVYGDEANIKISADAEGVRFDPNGATALVAFEQDHRVSRFDTDDLAGAIPVPVPLPALPGLQGNRGIEGIAIAPATGPLGGAVVIFSEKADDGTGGIRAWIVGGPMAGEFSVARRGAFDVTDADFLPGGDLFILERLFSLSDGIGFRIRRIAAEDIRPGATVDGPVVLFDDHLFQIDNMEGLALRELPSGEVLITLISDNNHSLLQRNLILQFSWRETIPPTPRERPVN